MKLEKIEKINNITNSDLEKYKKHTLIRRSKDVKGGFDKIVYATDQDLDGFHIRGLLNGFIEKYLPEFKGKVGMLQTPVILYTKNGKVTGWKYNLNDKSNYEGDATYVKGIGSWNSEDLKYIEGETGQELIDEWLGDDSSPRKKYILDNDFKIAMV